ncbi:MAG: YhbY family RNA-binding protein [Proteobacteria bacterium]|nr:YhbY family RNA-binding protein [Pseudomonadota bacterium]MBU1737993.1 YhbY family RNA-binding protein [Pseudomonadota bacterium]
MAKKMIKQSPLNSRQKKVLRGLSHHLTVKAMLGREGLTDQVVKSVLAVLAAHELIKVKVQENFPHDRKEAAVMLADKTGAALVQLVGRIITLYKGNRDLPEDQRIPLP